MVMLIPLRKRHWRTRGFRSDNLRPTLYTWLQMVRLTRMGHGYNGRNMKSANTS